MANVKKRLIIFTDIGDTIIDEGTEVRNDQGVVIHADCIPGAKETYLRLYEAGYAIVMVADGLNQSFRNTMRENGLDHIFSAWIISETVGEDKPSPKMFSAAMEAMGLTEADKKRILMIGNNVSRDIRGANRFGLISVLLDWSKRRPFDEELPEDHADYRIHTPEELLALADQLENR
ncbi:MAG: HAD hydrolase-like protein [Clostridia bacterium]|nr:HAD hydrolase-like protein [Clostridia bacterium]